MKLLTDPLWDVIKKYLRDMGSFAPNEELRDILEEHTVIECFDGGAFISYGNEFDLFVLPEKRGKWKIRSIVGGYLDKFSKKYDKVVVRINEENHTSLRLAKHFGFVEVSRENKLIRLEKSYGGNSRSGG